LDDHIKFIKLLYELILIPDLEASMISLFASTLHALLKKSYLISPAQLQLPWRPLYKVIHFFFVILLIFLFIFLFAQNAADAINIGFTL